MTEQQLNRMGAWGGFGYIALMLTAWIVFWQTNVFTTFEAAVAAANASPPTATNQIIMGPGTFDIGVPQVTISKR